jgi:hypothetical protein
VTHVDAAFNAHLRALSEQDGPWMTVYLRLAQPSEHDEQIAEIEWKNVAARLLQLGAAEETVAMLAEAVEHHERRAGALCLVASGSELALSIQTGQILERSVGDVGPVPRLVPLLAWAQSFVPHVIVITDRIGADITAVRFDRVADVDTVEGDAEHVHRGHPGGWSQRRFQQRAENQWESNAREIADEVARIADETGARLVAVAGDVRASQFMIEHLPQRVASVTREIEGARDGVSDTSIAEEVVRLEATVSAEETVAILQRHGDGIGSGLSVSGAEETLEALSERRVDTLLVGDDSENLDQPRSTAWFSAADPALVAPTGVADRLGTDAVEGPLGDVAIRAALRGGATVRVVPKHALDRSIGAILRFAG